MDAENSNEELVEVEVVPQTVNQIIYLQEEELEALDDRTQLFVAIDCDSETAEEYEIGSVPVDSDVLPYLTVTLQETQTDDNVYIDDDIDAEESAMKCGINLYECKVCNKRFKSWKFMSSHTITHGRAWKENLSKKKINCTQCRMTFDDPRSLTYHFQLHHDVPKSFICDICSCGFVSENGLAGHYRKHFHPKEYMCHICSAGYDSVVDMDNHYKTHRTNLLYACNKCDAGFAGTVELSAHLRTAHPRIPVPRVEVKVETVQDERNYYPARLCRRKVTTKDTETIVKKEDDDGGNEKVSSENIFYSIPMYNDTLATTTDDSNSSRSRRNDDVLKITKKRGRPKKKGAKSRKL